MTKKPHDMPEDFVPSLEFAKKYGMWESTYNFECEAFKNYHLSRANTGKIHDWQRAWMTWVLNWVKGSFSKSPMQQHGSPDANNGVKCFVLRKGNEKQAIAWLDYYNANNPEKYTFMIKNLKRIIEGWSDAVCQVTSEYPPSHGNVVQLELYRSVV